MLEGLIRPTEPAATRIEAGTRDATSRYSCGVDWLSLRPYSHVVASTRSAYHRRMVTRSVTSTGKLIHSLGPGLPSHRSRVAIGLSVRLRAVPESITSHPWGLFRGLESRSVRASRSSDASSRGTHRWCFTRITSTSAVATSTDSLRPRSRGIVASGKPRRTASMLRCLRG
jgi:hypothetical protein